MGSHIYLLQHRDKHFVKIGKANNVSSRVQGLGVGNFDLSRSVAFSVPNEGRAYNFEKTLHSIFAEHRVDKKSISKYVTSDSGTTEWFSVDIISVLEVCESLMSSFNASRSEIKLGRVIKQTTRPTDPYSNVEFLQKRLEELLTYNRVLHMGLSEKGSVLSDLRERIQVLSQQA